MAAELDFLADFAFDVWLLARQFRGRYDGRQWERAVASLLRRPETWHRQGPGTIGLFGHVSATGIAHEIDGAAGSSRGSLIVECKATADGISKGDAALFHFKIMDFYQRRSYLDSKEEWWPFMCATTPTPQSARVAALSLGLIVCDPGRLPLPVLLRAASRPTADLHLPDVLLQEMVRLGERALVPVQARWNYDAVERKISYDPRYWASGQINDLLWVEDELSADLLDLYDRVRPGALERASLALAYRMRKTA